MKLSDCLTPETSKELVQVQDRKGILIPNMYVRTETLAESRAARKEYNAINGLSNAAPEKETQGLSFEELDELAVRREESFVTRMAQFVLDHAKDSEGNPLEYESVDEILKELKVYQITRFYLAVGDGLFGSGKFQP